MAKSGGLPYISRPIRNTFAAHHSTATTEATPIAIDAHTCHQGGGVFDAIRRSMVNVLTGGTKLMMVLNVEFGSREMGTQNSHGVMMSSMIGIIIDCASRMSLTTLPTVSIIAPTTK